MGCMARVSCGVVRAADDACTTRDLSTAHRPQHATDRSRRTKLGWFADEAVRQSRSSSPPSRSSSPASATGVRISVPARRGTIMVDRRRPQAGAHHHALLPRPVARGADAGAADRERDAGAHRPAQPHRDRGSHRIVQQHAWLHHRRGVARRTRVLADATRPVPSPISRSSTPCVPAWRRSRQRCCCAPVQPYARKGALFDAHRKHFGKDGDPVLVWHAPTRAMNPRVPQAVIDAAMERDPAHAAAEYLARVSHRHRELHQVGRGRALRQRWHRRDRPPLSGCRYRAFVDPSGGSQRQHDAGDCAQGGPTGRDRPRRRTQATVLARVGGRGIRGNSQAVPRQQNRG